MSGQIKDLFKVNSNTNNESKVIIDNKKALLYNYVINYDEEGKKLSVGRINNNEMIDIWQYFDEDENLIYTYDYTSGIITSYSKDAKILLKFKDTEMIGKLQEIEKEILDDKVKSKITP